MSLSTSSLVFSPLTPASVEDVRALCADCFPLKYPDSWFKFVTSDKVYSMGAFSGDGRLVGMVVADVQRLSVLEGDIGPVLNSVQTDTTSMYILSLGVLTEYRHLGIGSYLVNSVLTHVSELKSCFLVYLHVLATNTQAIEFYRRLGFKEVCSISDYYHIQNRPAAGLVYCYYSNGGQPFQNNVCSYTRRYVLESVMCRWTTSLCGQLYSFLNMLFRKRSSF
ncbi:N-alpha-acetyltransferase 60-like [Halichondria panicea]|uniref:N-alpha-acetyltransferase 60-like n=1 Tax=Halichondria panicea TaxID=6063 RepID=UPI00312BC304